MKINKTLLVKELHKFNQLFGNTILRISRLKKYLIYLGLFVGLIFINYIFSIKIYGGQDFFINWASARLLFIQGINPYSQGAIKLLSDLAKELLILPGGRNYQFVAPLYSLFIYLPFGLIQNFNLSRAIWITIMESSAVLSGYLILIIFNWHPEKKIKKVVFAFSLLFFYVLLDLLNGSHLIFLNLLFILGFKLILEEKYVSAGIVLALLTIDIPTFFIPLAAIFIYIIAKKTWSFPLWFFITIFLLSLMASLLVTDWPLGLIREIMRSPIYANFGLPGDLVNQWINIKFTWIWNSVVLILSILLFYELFFFNNEKDSFLWKISLVLVLNPLIWMRSDLNSLVTLLLPFGLIFSQWFKRDMRVGSTFVVLLSTIFSFGMLCVGLLSQSMLFVKSYPFFLYYFPIIVLLINLYWIRWWMVRNVPSDFS